MPGESIYDKPWPMSVKAGPDGKTGASGAVAIKNTETGNE
jgi:hypothetical protein